MKTIGCVLVDVGPGSTRTRLVYIDDDKQEQVTDEHTVATLPSGAPRPGLPNKPRRQRNRLRSPRPERWRSDREVGTP